MDGHVPKDCSTAEHWKKHQVDQATRIELGHVDLDWEYKGELLIVWWVQENKRTSKKRYNSLMTKGWTWLHRLSLNSKHAVVIKQVKQGTAV